MSLHLDRDDLRRAFGREITSYRLEPIDPHLRIHSVTGGVYRVRADGDSCVIKVVRHGVDATADGLWQSGADVHHRNYWKREWLAFHSGLLDALPGQLRAPRTLLTTEYDDRTCWIWMEDVDGRTGSALKIEDYATIAHALGTTQGAYASGRTPLPDAPWLSRNWLRGWVETCAQFIETVVDDACWRDERLAAFGPLRSRVLALWSHREELFAVAAEPPLSIAHWDFWPANIYVGSDVVAIDWSQFGVSGTTHDLDQLTLDTVWMHVRPDESLDLLESQVLTAYTEGLRFAGLDVDADTVRHWYSAAAALRYAWLPGAEVELTTDPDRMRFHESRFGRDIASVLATRARVVEHALDLGEAVLGR